MFLCCVCLPVIIWPVILSGGKRQSWWRCGVRYDRTTACFLNGRRTLVQRTKLTVLLANCRKGRGEKLKPLEKE